eukprot:scaffold20303_cov30-Phaeocystis_antarctica.AAC.1
MENGLWRPENAIFPPLRGRVTASAVYHPACMPEKSRLRGSGALKTSFGDWAHASAFLFGTFEDQWRLLAFAAFETFDTSADYHPILAGSLLQLT